MSDWNADVYDRLSAPQEGWGRAVLDRLALRGDETVVDLGCGTGRLTARVLERLPRGRLIAVDTSPAMLEVARANLRPRFQGRVWFVRADAAAPPVAGAADVAFSTATFHWILDRDALCRGVFAALKPGGRLIAQCGGGPNLARLLARAAALVESPAFAAHFGGWREPWRFDAADTAARGLVAAGFVDVETSTHPSPVTFATAGEFEDFLSCVCVRHHIARLPPDRQVPFVRALSRQAAADDPPFTLDYWRLNLAARRPGPGSRPPPDRRAAGAL